MNDENFKNAVITVLSGFKEDFANNPLIPDGWRRYAVNRIEKAMNDYKRGFITASEALEKGIKPLNQPIEL